MLTKLALLAFVALMVWRLFLHRPKPKVGGGKPLPHPLDLVRCPRCGTHRLPGVPCVCERKDGNDGGDDRGQG